MTVFDVGTFEDTVFIAMEYIEGQTLKQWRVGEERSRKEILDLLKAAGRGLAAAHRAGIVHRDFKPGNVIVGSDAQVKVLDFGLARAVIGSRSEGEGGEPSEEFELPTPSPDSLESDEFFDSPVNVSSGNLLASICCSRVFSSSSSCNT